MSRTTAKTLHLAAASLALQASADDGPVQFTGMAYSGGLIPSWNAVIDLSSTTVADDMPLLENHDDACTIGTCKGQVSNGQLPITGLLFADIDANAKAIALKAKRGLKYQMSVGLYNADAKSISRGESVTVNGTEYPGPLTVLCNGTVRECSIVPLGADPQTSAHLFAESFGINQEAPMTEAEKAQLASLTASVEALTAENRDLKAKYEAASNELATVRLSARTKRVKDYFAQSGKAYTEEAAKPYLAMDEATLAILEADAKALRDRMPAHLFKETATGEPSAGNGNESALVRQAKAKAEQASKTTTAKA